MKSRDEQTRERITELDIKERWFLHMLATVGDCTKCKLHTVCEGKQDCVKNMQKAADRHAYKTMYETQE